MIRRLMELFYFMPPSFRLYLKKALRPLMDVILWGTMAFRDLKMPVQQIQSNGIRVIFIGHGAAMGYIVRSFFGRVIRPDYIKEISILGLKSEINKFYLKSDIIFVYANPVFLSLCDNKFSFDIMNLIRQARFVFIHKSHSWEVIVNDLFKDLRERDFKKLGNKIKKLGYEYEISHDITHLLFFYNYCYLPTIGARHAEVAEIKPLHEIVRLFEEGELLLVKQNKNIISAVLTQKKGDIYFAHFMGIMNGDNKLLFEQKAVEATYLFIYCAAYERGCKKLDFGVTVPFLNNGILQFKKKWGAFIEQDMDVSRRRRMIVCNQRHETFQILKHNPFICFRKGQLYSIVFLDRETEITDKQLDSLLRTYYQPGIAAIHIFVSEKDINNIVERLHTLRTKLSTKIPVPIEVFDLSDTL